MRITSINRHCILPVCILLQKWFFANKGYFSLCAFLLFSVASFTQPNITSFSPASAPANSTLTITGTGFAPSVNGNIVFFGPVKAVVNSATPTSLVVTVPFGSGYQPISVTANNLTALSAMPFALSFPGGGAVSSGMFDPQLSLVTDLHPNTVAFADFNGDGRADIATANNYSTAGQPASITILKNKSLPQTIAFDTARNISSGVLTFAVATGDLNADGKPDLVAVSIANKSLEVYKNTSSAGQISFASKNDYATGNSPYDIKIADFNADGKPDVAVANYLSNSISIFKNTSSGTTISFTAAIQITTGLAPESIAIGDFNGDGKPDIATSNELANTVSILKNTSASSVLSFASKVDLTVGDHPMGIAAGDLDGDGMIDLAVSNYYSYNISILRNVGSGGAITFVKTNLASSASSNSISIGDLNGDGKPDLVVQGSPILLYQNNSSSGTINFSQYNEKYVYPYSRVIAIGDVDGDGKVDMVGENYSGSNIMLYRNKANEPYISSFTPTVAASGSVITITGGNLGLASDVTIGGVAVTSFTVVNANTITAIVGAAHSGDVTVTTPYGIASRGGYVFPGPPAIQSFTPTTGTGGTVITITGINFVGTTEVKFGGIPASFRVISATIIKANLSLGASGIVRVKNAYGSDSLPGFNFAPPPRIISFTPQHGPTGSVVTISGENFSPLIQENTVYFGAIKAQVISASTTTIKVIAPAGISYDPIRLTTGTGGFIIQTNEPFTNTFPGAVSFTAKSFADGPAFYRGFHDQGAFSPTMDFVNGDFDDDGKPDIATVGRINYNPAVSIMKNVGQVDSAAFVPFASYSNPCDHIWVGDLDGDRKLDLITEEQGASIFAYKNTSTPGAISFAVKSIDTSVNNIQVVFGSSLADMDGDGKLDLVLIKSVGEVGILRNSTIDGDISFAKEVVVFNGTAEEVFVSDIDGDGKPDIITDNGYYNSGVLFYKNTSSAGHLSFAPPVIFSSGWNLGNIILADINGDHKPDLTLIELYTNKLSIYQNNSDTSAIKFSRVYNIPLPQNPGKLVANDLDGDGLTDLILNAGNFFNVYKNLSSGGSVSFSGKTSITPRFTGNISTADPDMDGRPDIMIMSEDSLLVLTNFIGRPTDVKVCAKGSTILTSDITGTAYQWQRNDGSGFSNISDNTTFTGTHAKILKLANIPAGWNTHIFRCLVNSTVASSTFRLMVTNPDTVSVSITPSTVDTLCQGLSITFTANPIHGGTAPSYQWLVNNVPVGDTGRTFVANNLLNNDQVKVMVTSNASCVALAGAGSNIVQVAVQDLPRPVTAVNGKIIMVTNPQQGAGYTWQVKVSRSWVDFSPLSTGTSFTADSSGVYRVRVKKSNCTAVSEGQNIGIIATPTRHEIFYGPNPASGTFHIDSLNAADQWQTVQVYNSFGAPATPPFNIVGQASITLKIQMLNQGLYFAVLRRSNGTPLTIRFIKI